MLLPGLSGARDRARDLACKNNFRQLGIALSLYIENHGGCLETPHRGRMNYLSAGLGAYSVDFRCVTPGDFNFHARLGSGGSSMWYRVLPPASKPAWPGESMHAQFSPNLLP